MFYRLHDYRLRPWLVPLLYSVIALAAGLSLPRLERAIVPHLGSPMSISAAMTMYSAIASGMIALTGVVFSLTFVMVQFSATSFSPRLALLMSRDPLLIRALGVFISTFIYALAALAWVDRSSVTGVPLISFWLVLGLLLASMGMFVALIERVGMLQVTRMLTFTADQGRKVIASMYAPLEQLSPCDGSEDLREATPVQTVFYHGRPRAVQSVDIATLARLAAQYNAVIEVVASVGDVVMELMPLLHVYGAAQKLDDRALNRAIVLGEQRTFTQDPKYAIRLLADIAIKALSPAINDPTTATQALDQIGDLLVRLGLSRVEIGTYRDSDGKLRLLVPFPSWDDFLRLGFDEILHCGSASVQVMRRMKALVSDLILVLPEERRPALDYWRHRLEDTITRSFSDAEEQSDASVEDRQGLGTTRRSFASAK